MKEQEKFRESLSALLELAKASDLKVTQAQISACFKEFELTEDQEKLIATYLEMNQVTVEDLELDQEKMTYLRGDEKKAPDAEAQAAPPDLDGEDSAVYRMYLEEISGIAPLSEEEIRSLPAAMLAGDEKAKQRLTEGYLGRVVELAGQFAGQGVLLGDLVQEGNMAMLLTMEAFDEADFGVYITKKICEAMDAAVAEQNGQENTGNYLASQANALMHATERLVAELGREASLEEVAKYMNLSEDMARDIMKISMDALNVVEANQSGEVFGETGE